MLKTGVLVGKIVAPHGVKGCMKLMSYMENPVDIFNQEQLDSNGNTIKLKKVGVLKDNMFIVQLDGVEDRNKAESLRNFEIYIKELKKLNSTDEFYIKDLINMKAIADDGREGLVINVYNYGAGDVLEIEWSNGKQESIAFNNAYVRRVDMENHVIHINAPIYI